jgi:hypothetical protein
MHVTYHPRRCHAEKPCRLLNDKGKKKFTKRRHQGAFLYGSCHIWRGGNKTYEETKMNKQTNKMTQMVSFVISAIESGWRLVEENGNYSLVNGESIIRSVPQSVIKSLMRTGALKVGIRHTTYVLA